MKTKPDWSSAARLPPDDLARALEADRDEIDDNPATTEAELAELTPMKRRPGQRGPGKRPARVPVTIRIDSAALDAWRGTGPGWQARLNELITRQAPKPRKRA